MNTFWELEREARSGPDTRRIVGKRRQRNQAHRRGAGSVSGATHPLGLRLLIPLLKIFTSKPSPPLRKGREVQGSVLQTVRRTRGPGTAPLQHQKQGLFTNHILFSLSDDDTQPPLRGLQLWPVQSTGSASAVSVAVRRRCADPHPRPGARTSACSGLALPLANCSSAYTPRIWSRVENRKRRVNLGFPQDSGDTNSF